MPKKNNTTLTNYASELSKTGGWQYCPKNKSFEWTRYCFRLFEIEEDKPESFENFDKFLADGYAQLLVDGLENCLQAGGSFHLNAKMRSKYGMNRWLQISGVPVKEGEEIIAARGIFQDITENKKVESTLLKYNVQYKAQLDMLRIISNTLSMEHLFRGSLEVFVHELEFDWGWVSKYDDEYNLQPVFQLEGKIGHKESFDVLLQMEVFKYRYAKDDDHTEVIINDFVVLEDDFAEWRERITLKNLRSFIALPLRHKEKNFGTLNLYSRQVNFVDLEKKHFINRLVDEMAYGINNLENLEERQNLIEYNELLLSSINAIAFKINLNENKVMLTGTSEFFDGYSFFDRSIDADEIIDLIHPNDARMFQDEISKAFFNDEFVDIEYRALSFRGEYVWMNLLGKVYKPVSTRMKSIIGIALVIDDKRQREREFLKAQIQGRNIERQKISKEIHDGLGQTLTAVGINLSVIKKKMKSHLGQDLNQLLDETQELLSNAIDESRYISQELMPGSLSELGLTKVIKSKVNRLTTNTKHKIDLEINLPNRIGDQEKEVAIYNILKELLDHLISSITEINVNIQLLYVVDKLVLRIESKGHTLFVQRAGGYYNEKSTIIGLAKSVGGSTSITGGADRESLFIDIPYIY